MLEEAIPVRILIVDDHAIFRDGLSRLLATEPGLSVCGEAADGYQALQMVDELRPDLLLLDLTMPGLPGLEVLTRLYSRSEYPRTIVLTAAADASLIIRAFQLGSKGVVLKESATRVLFDSIRCVMNGGYWAGEHPGKDMTETLELVANAFPTRRFASGYGLTTRELQIVTAIRNGATNKEVATQFSISEHTVKNHLSSIYSKLGVSSRLEVAILAQNTGLGSDLKTKALDT